RRGRRPRRAGRRVRPRQSAARAGLIVGGRRGALRRGTARFWREYTRMRTAIFFLIGVVAIVAVGSFVPQQGTSAPEKVQQFLSGHANMAGLFANLQLPLTEVFVSPVFYVLLGSLYLALVACVVRRGRALVARTWRRY